MRRLLLFCLLMVMGIAASAQAAERGTAQVVKTLDFESFALIPVLHEGRVKPMDSFARAVLKRLSGQESGALRWLADTLFNPAYAEKTRVLEIRNPEVADLLQLPHRKDRLYNYLEVKEALIRQRAILTSVIKTPQEQWIAGQKDFVDLSENLVLLGELLSSMSLYLPLSVTLPEDVPAAYKDLSGRVLTYTDVLKHRDVLRQDVVRIVQDKGEEISGYTEAEQALAYLSFSVENIRASAAESRIFKVIPSWDGGTAYAPWQIISEGRGTPQTKVYFGLWQNAARAFHRQDTQSWDRATQDIYERSTGEEQGIVSRPASLKVELFYNSLSPFRLAAALYILALLFLTGGGMWQKRMGLKAACAFMGLGATIHLGAVLARMYILMRPPVTTLYESIIFVGLVAVLYSLWMFVKKRDVFWLYLGCIAGVLIQLIGFSHDRDGDSMVMLTAVLNTNFWLATHVICIVLGYAFSILTSSLAHYVLYLKMRGQEIAAYFTQLHKTAIMALLFAAIGTVLGGIWADQSWGRFWGWDPKENGALLIVLWLIWVLHGRVSGQMKRPVVVAGLAYLSVIVALSWFGVNLLGVGLHAYGFTDSAAFGLLGFVIAETLLIGGLLYKIRAGVQAEDL